jgi:hypothetical protein
MCPRGRCAASSTSVKLGGRGNSPLLVRELRPHFPDSPGGPDGTGPPGPMWSYSASRCADLSGRVDDQKSDAKGLLGRQGLLSTSPAEVAHGTEGVEADQAPDQLAATYLSIGPMLEVALRGCDQRERDRKEYQGREPACGREVSEVVDHTRHGQILRRTSRRTGVRAGSSRPSAGCATVCGRWAPRPGHTTTRRSARPSRT